MNCNLELVQKTLELLEKLNASTIVVCPGARNSPFIPVLRKSSHFEVIHSFEERSASFFALGRARATDRPSVVITTSGTACAELLPAVMEAHYSGAKLIVITADRPKRYRGTGAPQTADQVNLFGTHVSQSLDISEPNDLQNLKPQAPSGTPNATPRTSSVLHLNISFEEPLPFSKQDTEKLERLSELPKTEKCESLTAIRSPLAAPGGANPLSAFLAEHKNPFVIVGTLSENERASVANFLNSLQAPSYFEGLSGLRESPEIAGIRIQFCDKVVDRLKKSNYNVDSILRIGGVPTHRIWRDIDEKLKLPTLSVSTLNFSGTPDGDIFVGDLNEILSTASINEKPSPQWKSYFDLEKPLAEKFEKLLLKYPRSETGMIYSYSNLLPKKSFVYVGNSLPVREWDLAAATNNKDMVVSANRGLNGIDGQISSFMGLAPVDRFSACLVGDLTALYDLSSPSLLPNLKPEQFQITIVNNGGGKIFERMFKGKEFLNEHSVEFEHWAKMWKLSYEKVTQLTTLPKAQVLELKPDANDTKLFWSEYEQLLN